MSYLFVFGGSFSLDPAWLGRPRGNAGREFSWTVAYTSLRMLESGWSPPFQLPAEGRPEAIKCSARWWGDHREVVYAEITTYIQQGQTRFQHRFALWISRRKTNQQTNKLKKKKKNPQSWNLCRVAMQREKEKKKRREKRESPNTRVGSTPV